jgi:hypothetical protein
VQRKTLNSAITEVIASYAYHQPSAPSSAQPSPRFCRYDHHSFSLILVKYVLESPTSSHFSSATNHSHFHSVSQAQPSLPESQPLERNLPAAPSLLAPASTQLHKINSSKQKTKQKSESRHNNTNKHDKKLKEFTFTPFAELQKRKKHQYRVN